MWFLNISQIDSFPFLLLESGLPLLLPAPDVLQDSPLRSTCGHQSWSFLTFEHLGGLPFPALKKHVATWLVVANEIRAEVTRDASGWKHLNWHASPFSVSLLLWPPTFQMEKLLSARVIVWGRRGTQWGMMLTRSKPLSHWILEPSPQHNLAYPDRCVASPPSLALQLESCKSDRVHYHPFMTPSTVRRRSKCFLWPYPTLLRDADSFLPLTPLPHPYLHLYSSCPELLITGSIVVLCSLPGFSVCCSCYPEYFSRILPSLSTWLTPTLLRLTSDILSNRKPSLTSSLAQKLPLEHPQSLGFVHNCSDHSRLSLSEEQVCLHHWSPLRAGLGAEEGFKKCLLNE